MVSFIRFRRFLVIIFSNILSIFFFHFWDSNYILLDFGLCHLYLLHSCVFYINFCCPLVCIFLFTSGLLIFSFLVPLLTNTSDEFYITDLFPPLNMFGSSVEIFHIFYSFFPLLSWTYYVCICVFVCVYIFFKFVYFILRERTSERGEQRAREQRIPSGLLTEQ